MSRWSFICIFMLLLSNNLFAQHSKPDTLIAFFFEGKIKPDGQLNEECWGKAAWIENFTQREQNEGSPATEKTKVAAVYNNSEIYFGIWCYDSEPSKISAQKMVRDFSWSSDDNIEIMISPFNDNRNGYLFVTNPNGALADVWVGDQGKDFNKDWNGVWDAAVVRNESGWFAEIVIPFSTLKFTGDSIQVWGINFERNIRRKKEQVLWQGWSRLYDIEKISQGGKLAGIRNIRQGTKIEIKPFLLGGTEFYDGKNYNKAKIGGEINFDITPTFKLNLTANTDFAQVEADRRQINLTRFSLFYPEKRQFFLEGKSYYELNVGNTRLFYSRRIGIDNNNEVPIIGGLRLFGKLSKTNVGLMSLQTYAKDTIPTTNYSIIRIQQDIFKQSSVGVILTQKLSNQQYNRVYGTDFTYSTSDLFGEKNLIISSAIAFSETQNLKGNHIANKDNLTYNVFINYPNDIVEYDLGFTKVEKGFSPQMGFVNRKNYQMIYTELQLSPRFKSLPFFRNLVFKPFDINYYINDQTGEMESVFYEWRPFGFDSKSGESFEFNVQHIFDRPTEEFELIDGIFVPAGSYRDNRYEIQIETFRGRKLAANTTVSIGDFYTGHRQEVEVGMYLNLSNKLNLSFDWQRNFVSLPQENFRTDEIGGRFDYSFNTKLQTSLFAQWNNEDHVVLLNYRINWIPKIGSFFYFLINQEFDTENKITLERTTIMGKLIWRFAL